MSQFSCAQILSILIACKRARGHSKFYYSNFAVGRQADFGGIPTKKCREKKKARLLTIIFRNGSGGAFGENIQNRMKTRGIGEKGTCKKGKVVLS